ncbi:MAG: ATP-binding protein [Oscillospiraceae bacterium]|nr:ATP-binding protein [Oscillospiraceae bacterium]
MPFNRTKSELLFQVISARSERAGVIISTNPEFSRWTELFENDMMLRALGLVCIIRKVRQQTLSDFSGRGTRT